MHGRPSCGSPRGRDGNDNKLRYYSAPGTGAWQGPFVFPDAAFSPGSKIGTYADSTNNSGQFLDEFHAAPAAGVATALTYGASKPTVFFAGINTVIRTWYSPVPNRYTPGAPWDPRPHGATQSSPNEPTRFAPMRQPVLLQMACDRLSSECSQVRLPLVHIDPIPDEDEAAVEPAHGGDTALGSRPTHREESATEGLSLVCFD